MRVRNSKSAPISQVGWNRWLASPTCTAWRSRPPARPDLATPALLAQLLFPDEQRHFAWFENSAPPRRPRCLKPSFPHETWPCDTCAFRGLLAFQGATGSHLVRESRRSMFVDVQSLRKLAKPSFTVSTGLANAPNHRVQKAATKL
jgi:hypothetical protein